MNERSGEQVLAELRRDLADVPPGAMERMRYAVHSGTPPTSPAFRSRSAGSRLLRPAVVGGIAAGLAVAVAGGVVAVNATGRHSSGANQASGAASGGTAPGVPGRGSTGAAPVRPTNPQALLGQAALAARQTSLAPRDDQFIYTATISDGTYVDGHGRTRPFTDVKGQAWLSADGSRPGWSDSIDKQGHPTGGPVPPQAAASTGLGSPTYEFLTTLPTDPDALLAEIRKSVHTTATSKPHAIDDENQATFNVIGDLLRTGVLPPRLAGALYQAAAKIPGIKIDQNAVDAAGRHGIGVSRTMASPAGGPVEGRVGGPATTPGGPDAAVVDYSQWIFNPTDHHLLGTVLGSSLSTNSIALTKVAVVDHPRQLPK
jgi:hypothetical protein